MPRPRRLLAAPLAVAAALSGCGGSGTEDEVRAAVNGYAKAVAKRDYQALCDRYLAPSVVTGVERAGLPCEAALRPELSTTIKPALAIRSIRVDGERARVAVHTTAANQPPADVTLALVKVRGSWRIASTAEAGPQPAAP